ncbi:MAG: ATP synthase subunit C [Oscillospiraceae bacterium]
METLLLILLPLVAIALITAPIIRVLAGKSKGIKAKHAIITNLCVFGGVCVLAFLFPVGGILSAAGEVSATATGMGFLSAAIVTGLSCLGAGIAVASAAPAAIGAVSEDPKSFGKAMIFVVLGEGVAIYGLLISILILNRL